MCWFWGPSFGAPGTSLPLHSKIHSLKRNAVLPESATPVDSTDEAAKAPFVPEVPFIAPPIDAPTPLLSGLDSDGDGIPDAVDLDDDNDGIPDENEMTCISPFTGTPGPATPVNGGTVITDIYTNYQGYWHSSTTSINPVKPTSANEILAFKVNGTIYATGVGGSAVLDTDGNGLYDMLDINGDGIGDLPMVETKFKGINPNAPIINELALEGATDDGNLNVALGMTVGTPNQDERVYLTNGTRSLNIASGLANIGSTWYFNLPNYDVSGVGDGIPDVMIAQVAQIGGVNVKFTFYDQYGTALGNTVVVSETGGLSGVLGQWIQDIYNFNGTVFATKQTKDIRLATMEISETNMTLAQAGTIAFLKVEVSANADLAFVAVNSKSLGSPCTDKDSDGDGIPDRLDLDSDNDGIYDLIEAGHGKPDVNHDGRIDGAPAAFGADGLFNAVETSPDSGVLNYTIKDSDGDGHIDAIEIDSDNDGCNDVIEAGFLDQNGDGRLGPLPLTVDGNGVVTSGGP